MGDTKFTKGSWHINNTYSTMLYITADDHGVCEVDCDTLYATPEISPTTEQQANAHLIAAAPDMYKSLERQRTGLINLIDLSLIPESHIESVRHEVTLIDNELSRARGE